MQSQPGPAPLKLIMSAVLLVIFSVILLRQTWRSPESVDEQSQIARAQMQLSQLLIKVANWVISEPHALPLTQENLEAAVSDGSQQSILDPWGNAIRVEVIEPQPGWFRLTSAGPNGELGTADGQQTALLVVEQFPLLALRFQQGLDLSTLKIIDQLLVVIDPGSKDHHEELPGLQNEAHDWLAAETGCFHHVARIANRQAGKPAKNKKSITP